VCIIAPMFATTFLGHQGWLFQTEQARVLVDPLLCSEFGQIHGLDYRVFPPRMLDLEAFPAIDALVLSHEHDDHFDIPSLALLDRSIPVYLSVRSSNAARTILSTMGFTVHPLVPGLAIAIGDLELLPFCGDHLTVECGDEWDTLPFSIRQTSGAGSFFSLVDITLTPGHLAWARIHVPRPGLISWTNNSIDWSHMANYVRERVEATAQFTVQMTAGHKLINSLWGQPSATLMCAGGFAFQGERAWLNERVFCVDGPAVAAAMNKTFGKGRFFSTLPGQTFFMDGNRVKKIEDSTPFLRAAPTEDWPTRARLSSPYGPDGPPDYAPATGRRQLGVGEHERLERGLQGLADSLVGGTLFKSLCSILTVEAQDRRPTIALSLRDGDGEARRFYEHDLQACAFVAADPAASAESYLAGMECWATDLLSVLDGELGPIALLFGRARLWNFLPGRLNFDPFAELYRVSHPLRRPDAMLRVYQREWAKAAGMTPAIGRH
jgi:Beta-lactamase superfamily domain